MRTPLGGLKSGDLLAGDHALRRERNLMRTGRAKLVGNLKAATNLKHPDNVRDRKPIPEPQPSRCNVYSSLRVVHGIGLVRASFGQRSSELKRVLSVG